MDQASLWDEPIAEATKDDEPITQEEFEKGGKPGTEGQYVRVYYVDDYTPTPGLITARDVYNAWCVSQQATAKVLRDFYGYHQEASTIERNIWIWNGVGPDTTRKFERMAEHLMKIIASKEESK